MFTIELQQCATGSAGAIRYASRSQGRARRTTGCQSADPNVMSRSKERKHWQSQWHTIYQDVHTQSPQCHPAEDYSGLSASRWSLIRSMTIRTRFRTLAGACSHDAIFLSLATTLATLVSAFVNATESRSWDSRTSRAATLTDIPRQGSDAVLRIVECTADACNVSPNSSS